MRPSWVTETARAPSAVKIEPRLRPRPAVDDERTEVSAGETLTYTVEVEGARYVVAVAPGGEITQIEQKTAAAPAPAAQPGASTGKSDPLVAPLAGTIIAVRVTTGQSVSDGQIVLILEAMKMETEVRAARAGTVADVLVKKGDNVAVGDTLLTLA